MELGLSMESSSKLAYIILVAHMHVICENLVHCDYFFEALIVGR